MKTCALLLLITGVCHGFRNYQPQSAPSNQNPTWPGSDDSKLKTDDDLTQQESKLVPSVVIDNAAIFSYDSRDQYGPKSWGRISKFCDGSSQSPVNINTLTAIRERAPPLIIDGYNTLPSNITITNSGHSATLKLNFVDNSIRFRGGPLSGSYILDNIHWHWGRSDDAGSEHTINFKQMSAEMHLVTYSSQYRSLAEAQQQPKGLAVIAIFYEVENSFGATFNPFIPLLSRVTEPKSTFTDTRNIFSLRDVIKSENFHFLSYKGSLTTPNCYETVTWLVSTSILTISPKELAQFRKIKDEKSQLLLENHRPLQDLNKRRVGYF